MSVDGGEAGVKISPRKMPRFLSVDEPDVAPAADGDTSAGTGCLSLELSPLASVLLVSGEYEGGGALWECALDASTWIQRERERVELGTAEASPHLALARTALETGSTLLELGAGMGVPTLSVLLNNETRRLVLLADYNEEVLRDVTAPTVARNRANWRAAHDVRYLAGDWSGIPDLLQTSEVPAPSLIIATDCLYSEETCASLARVLATLMVDTPGAVALVAAKQYYFGVGGGTFTFTKALAPHPLTVRVVERIEDGKSNVREILVICRDADLD
jgi:hypothetical protein